MLASHILFEHGVGLVVDEGDDEGLVGHDVDGVGGGGDVLLPGHVQPVDVGPGATGLQPGVL